MAGKMVVVLGPTASGKSALAVTLARQFNGEVISADSRQVYKGLDIGTGKITREEMQGIPHHLLDVALPGEDYNVVRYQKEAYDAIDAVLARHRLPILTGGTGLYLRAVTDGYVFAPAPPSPELRENLEKLTTEELRTRAEQSGISVTEDAGDNRPRLIRLLEKAECGVDPACESKKVPRYETLLLGTYYPRDVLYARIEKRLTDRLAAGMVEEVSRLRRDGVSDDFLERIGLEYRFILHYLTGQINDETELIEKLGTAIKHFAKRQITWFRKDCGVYRLSMEENPVACAAELIQSFLGGTTKHLHG